MGFNIISSYLYLNATMGVRSAVTSPDSSRV